LSNTKWDSAVETDPKQAKSASAD